MIRPSNDLLSGMKDYLDFEQPIIELQSKLDALTRTTQTSGVEVDFEGEAKQIREKIEETRKAIYSKLTPWQRIQLARHPRRPYTLDYIETAFDDLKKAFGGNDCAPIGDLTYSIGVEVVPTIKWTGDYRKLKVTVQSPGDDVTDAAEAESIFNAALRNLGTMRAVADRGREVGDQVVVDLSAANKATGEEIEGIKQEKFNLDTGAARLNLPGLVDGIVGMKTGETREVPITMPDDWLQAFIRGVEATFTITVSSGTLSITTSKTMSTEAPGPTKRSWMSRT